MFVFAALFAVSFKAFAIAVSAALVGGGALGFLFGGKVEAAAQAEAKAVVSKASAAIDSASKKL